MTGTVVHVASGREWRGGQRQVWLLARALQRLGVPQVVVTGDGSELARRVAADGVRVRRATWRAGLDPRALWAIRSELGAGAALLHAHDAHALTLAGLARLGRTVPLVVTRRVTYPIRRRAFWTRADRVIAISPAVRSALTAHGVLPARVEVIPSGVDLSALPEDTRSDLRLRLGLADGTPLALNIAALTPEKDHATLLRAAAVTRDALPELHWAIAGEGPLRGEIERDIRALGLERHVSLLGADPDPDGLLASATVFVLSSTSEGLGSSVLAAWTRGTPVVASRVGGLAELLGSGAGLTAAPGDAAGFADAVQRIVAEPGLREELVRRGRAEVRQYDVHGMAARVLAVYRSCAYSIGES